MGSKLNARRGNDRSYVYSACIDSIAAMIRLSGILRALAMRAMFGMITFRSPKEVFYDAVTVMPFLKMACEFCACYQR
jgi:hypothetical protein